MSPHIIVRHSKSTACVTIHADIDYSLVNRASVALQIGSEEIPATAVFADDRGDLVAKFNRLAVNDRIAPPTATLTLTGLLKDGTQFAGSETVAAR